MRNPLGAALLLQLSISFDSRAVFFPPGRDLDGLVLQNISAVIPKARLVVLVEAELVDARRLVHEGVKRGSAHSRVGLRLRLFSHKF